MEKAKKVSAKKALLKKKTKAVKEPINPGHYHEACDRTFSVLIMIDQLLRTNPVITQDKKLMKLLEAAESALGDIYLKTGQKM